ncbi:MAG: hypothetical protein PHO27_09685 [Sulfuricurvum sp.]|nr:hypothetical protein [Sulfuricurvum sp.]
MQRIGYIIVIAFIVLLFKAFYLDDYLANRVKDHNRTVMVNSVDSNTEIPQSNNKISESSEEKQYDTPVDRLFNAIGDKLQKKL